jgi:AbrB family looped-hinge helix DNA binding protein
VAAATREVPTREALTRVGLPPPIRLLPYLDACAILSFMSTARIYKKGQVTIPKAVREATGIDVGDRVVVEARNDEIVLRRPSGVLEFTPPQPRTTTMPWPETRRAAREDRAARRRRSDDR